MRFRFKAFHCANSFDTRIQLTEWSCCFWQIVKRSHFFFPARV